METPAGWRWVAFLAPSTFAAQVADRLVVAITTGVLFLRPLRPRRALAFTLLFGSAALLRPLREIAEAVV